MAATRSFETSVNVLRRRHHIPGDTTLKIIIQSVRADSSCPVVSKCYLQNESQRAYRCTMLFSWCGTVSNHNCTPLEGLHLKRLSHAYKTQQSGDNATPGVWDAPPPWCLSWQRISPSCITRKIKGVLWLDAGQCQLQYGLVGLTSPRLTMDSKVKPPKGGQNLQIAVVWTVIPGRFLLTFLLEFLKRFPNLTPREFFFRS
jgi:hypothetical protein